jgi:hypothetical protein
LFEREVLRRKHLKPVRRRVIKLAVALASGWVESRLVRCACNLSHVTHCFKGASISKHLLAFQRVSALASTVFFIVAGSASTADVLPVSFGVTIHALRLDIRRT